MGDGIKRLGWPTHYFSLCTCGDNSCGPLWPDSNPGGLWLIRPHPSVFKQHPYIPSRSPLLSSTSWMLPFYMCVQTAASSSSMQAFWHFLVFMIVIGDCFEAWRRWSLNVNQFSWISLWSSKGFLQADPRQHQTLLSLNLLLYSCFLLCSFLSLL